MASSMGTEFQPNAALARRPAGGASSRYPMAAGGNAIALFDGNRRFWSNVVMEDPSARAACVRGGSQCEGRLRAGRMPPREHRLA